MNKIHRNKITDFLRKIEIEQIAKNTKFRIRKPRKIDAYNFLLSFFLTMSNKDFSLRKWAIKITKLSNKLISFQAIAKKMDSRQLVFAKAIFSKSVEKLLLNNTNKVSNKLVLKFNRVFLEDSSCVKLCSALYKHFSGSANQNGRTAIGRIQFCFDLKSNTIEKVELNTYSKNDLTYADKILERLRPNDLLIRDLGYFITSVFQEIIDRQAFFISRLKLNVGIFDSDSEKEFDIVKHLKKLDRQGINQFDKSLKITATQKLKVRIVAVKLTDSQAARRRRQAKENRHNNVKVSQKSMYLLSWNIFITNVDDKRLTIQQVYQLYALRWQIELVFKNWKSYFKIDNLMKSCKGPNSAKPEMLMYLSLTFWALIYVPKLNYYRQLILKQCGKHLSPNKFASFLLDNLEENFFNEQKNTIDLLINFCCYDKRKDRVNNYEKLYQSSS